MERQVKFRLNHKNNVKPYPMNTEQGTYRDTEENFLVRDIRVGNYTIG